MPRLKIRTVTQAREPRRSISGVRGGREGGNLIDLGAEPILRYGVVYITEIEAAQIAAHIGWVDGNVVRAEYERLELENRELRAELATLPLAAGELTEGLKDDIAAAVRDRLAGYDAALDRSDLGDPVPLPAELEGHAEPPRDDDGRDPKNLTLPDDGSAGSDDDDELGHADADREPDLGQQGSSDPAAAGGAGDDGAASGDGAEDVVRAGGASVAAAAEPRLPVRITDIVVGNGDADAGD